MIIAREVPASFRAVVFLDDKGRPYPGIITPEGERFDTLGWRFGRDVPVPESHKEYRDANQV